MGATTITPPRAGSKFTFAIFSNPHLFALWMTIETRKAMRKEEKRFREGEKKRKECEKDERSHFFSHKRWTSYSVDTPLSTREYQMSSLPLHLISILST
jgi:hypothetical protein